MKCQNILIGIVIVLASVSCQNINKKETKSDDSKSVINENVMKTSDESGSLDAKLDERRMEFAKVAPDETKKVYAEGIQAVKKSGILEKALNVGDKVPDFVLNNQMNKSVSLSEELENGPVVLIWYRGGWCPYCNITLHFLQEKLPEFKALGASLIALTPELPDKSISTSEKHELEFSVLSDVDNKVAKEYGVVFELTPEVASIYQKAFNLHDYNGNESNELPLAVTYVVDKEGVIQYAFLDADYRNRAEPEEIISALKKLKLNK
ncbi:peroxiredoxin-like family protein [Labilibaculum filiforme]|nr:peroxiredoxin-like family protein [Labilibaculum filiforme]